MKYFEKFQIAAISIAVILVTRSSAWGLTFSYFQDVASKYNTFIVVRVSSAETVPTPDGSTCFYKYNAHLVDIVKGDFDQKVFSFYYEEGLTVGTNYLIYFSRDEALTYRIFATRADKKEEQYCENQRTGYLFTYKELHEIVKIWPTEYIKFDDPWAGNAVDISSKYVKEKSLRLVDFGYVRQKLEN